MPNTTLSWTIEPASNPIIMFFSLLLMISIVAIIVSSTNSPFYLSVSVILISFSYGLGLAMVNMSWFFLSLVIMFLGGMMVVFVYASSLGSNFVMKFSVSVSSMVGAFCAVFTVSLLTTNQAMGLIPQSLASIYTLPSLVMVILLGSVLMAILFVVSKMVAINDGAMKL